MSQWGAQGAATQGLNAQQILDFYYPGTTRTQIGTPTVRVLLSGTTTSDLRMDSTAGTTVMAIQDASTGVTAYAPPGSFRVLTSGTSQRLLRYDGSAWVNFSIGGSGVYAGPLAFWSEDGVTVWTSGSTARNYRGSINVVRTGSGVSVAVNNVNMQDYLMGVVPKESPPSWLPAALQAQAVAARSYAWWDVQTPSAGHYDICDTTACQVYGGRIPVERGPLDGPGDGVDQQRRRGHGRRSRCTTRALPRSPSSARPTAERARREPAVPPGRARPLRRDPRR